MAALCVNAAARSCWRDPSIRPPRPPKSSTRYESDRLGVISDWVTALRPRLATVLRRVAVTSPSTVGNRSPRAEPYAAAAAWAFAHARCVLALLRNPMSTISGSVRRWMRSPRSAGIAPMPDVSAAATLRASSAGGCQGTCGAGDAPGTPDTLGVPTQPAAARAATTPNTATRPTRFSRLTDGSRRAQAWRQHVGASGGAPTDRGLRRSLPPYRRRRSRSREAGRARARFGWGGCGARRPRPG